MTVQAGAARTIHQSDPKAAGEAIAAVETAGRNALREMRDLLGVLRPDKVDSRLAPQPGMADIPELIEQVNRTGQNVVLQVSGECHALSKRMELAVFRIVQEALTNVIKHAGENVQVKVDIDGQPEQIVLRIRDNGVGGAHVLNQAGRSGHGIVGMRERAEMLGGSLRAYVGASGGFEVHAVLPRTNGDA